MGLTVTITTTVLLSMTLQLCWPCVRSTLYCIIPEDHSSESCPEADHTWPWSEVNQNFAKYFVSHSEMYFLPGEYRLNDHLIIKNVTNLSLIGLKNSVTFNCTSDKGGIFSVYNTAFVTLKNMKFLNCGMLVNAYNNASLSSTTMAVLFAYKMLSMTISNVTFENARGHAIIGVNVLNNILIESVLIKNTLDIAEENNNHGIVFIYYDDFNLNTKNYRHSILLQTCHFINLTNMKKLTSSQGLDSVNSVVIGLAFYQKKYDIKIKVQDCHIENVTSSELPLISISYKPFSQTKVKFTNTTFANNTINKAKVNPMFNVEVYLFLTNRFLHIILYNCRFYKNHLSIWNKKTDTYNPLKVALISNKFVNNTSSASNIWIFHFKNFAELTIQDCMFSSNVNSTLGFKSIKTLRFTGRNMFKNNSAVNHLLYFDITYPKFEGYHEFSYNQANKILSVDRYMTLSRNTTINITNNNVWSNINTTKKEEKLRWAIIHIGTRDTLFQCSFQFNVESYPQVSNIRINMMNNRYYSYAVFGTQMNSCFWRSNNTHGITPGLAYTSMFTHDRSLKPFVNRGGAMLCYCKNDSELDCFKDRFQSIFPGQIVNINLTLLPPITPTALYIDFSKLLNNSIYSPCEVPSSKIYLISNKCTALSYKIKFNSLKEHSCSMYLKTTSTPETLFIYYFDHKECPIGFQFINGECDCDPHLKAAFPTLICDIDSQILARPPKSWIGTSHTAGNNEIYYVERCLEYFCSWEPTNIQLQTPDTQCINNRVGIMCAKCAAGLDSVFGSFACKKCSNNWLLLLPVFMLAGVLLVLSLFLLNITVVHGNINGFVLYVNILVGNNYVSFPKRSVTTTFMSLFNLDLGIETCFYHGMTEYDKTWLQLSFPAYILLIVATLAFASRYSSSVERLTRQRVIPVIATIFLLSYNKLLLATTKVLFSYKAVHKLDDNSKHIIWMWDSSISLTGVKFIFLFVVCLIVFLLGLVPLNVIVLFTKFFYRFSLIVKYLKPYVDACQAPFKDKFHYFFGIELLMRPIYFTLGNRILNVHETLSLIALTTTLLLAYLCIFQPLKCTANNVLYISYAINALFITFTFVFYNLAITKSYNIILNGLVLIALLEFGGTILHCFYTSHLKRIVKVQILVGKFTGFVMKHLPKNCKSKTDGINMAEMSNEDRLREELLIAECIL